MAMNNEVPMINGELYGWAQVKLAIAGVYVRNVTAIKYADNQEIVNVYAGGRTAVGYGKGRIECSGEITLLKEEVVSLQSSISNGRIQDIPPFDITVTYLHPQTNKVVTDTLHGCLFTSNDNDVSEGDTSISQTIPLMISSIEYGQVK